MKLMYLTVLFAFIFSSCNNDETEQLSENTNKIVVDDVLQTGNYTYLAGKVNGTDTWIAVSKISAKPGDIYYYEGGMVMKNFVSKELDQTFDKIWFVDVIRTTPEAQDNGTANNDMSQYNMKPTIEKGDYSIATPEGGISIKDLFSNKNDWDGKTIKVRGIVTKVNSQIMDRNWIHIQDGSEHEGEYDLTITSQMSVQEGDTITAMGTISFDKDFGFGYQYKVIMEDAEIK